MQESTTELEEIKSKQDDITVEDHEEKISEAWSLALQFMSKYPSCIRAIPYKDGESLKMWLYMDTNGETIPEKIKKAAKDAFQNYEIDDLSRRPLNKIVTRLPSSKKKAKELADLSRKIKKNLHLFENRMNVTAVQASYKVTNSIEENTPCVTVYVLGKGKIPAGESDIKKIKEENGDIFNETEFDVAEGYYKMTNGPALEGHARPLQGGIGIGVEGVDGAGTLGGFLEDKEGKVYILSNKHVLHHPDQEVIVQPSKLDYKNMQEKARSNIQMWTDEIQNIPTEINRECRSFLVRKMAEKIEKNTTELSEIEQNPPRQIGTYVTGLQENVEIDGEQFYVDAAIAALDISESHIMKFYKTHMEDQTNRCPLYGFETNKYWKTEDYKPPNGEIIDFQNFHNRLDNEHSELRFMKIGRTTGFTDEVLPPLFLRLAQRTCNRLSWAYNCLPIRKRVGSFSEKGDSGSLVFDQDGRAWGLVTAKFRDFIIVLPLFAIVNALQRKARIQELKLWCTPNDEGPEDE